MTAGLATAKNQRLAVFRDDGSLLLSGFPLIATQIWALPLHLGGGLGQGAFQVRTQLIDRILNIALIQGQKICRLHGVGAEGSLLLGARPVNMLPSRPYWYAASAIAWASSRTLVFSGGSTRSRSCR